MSAPEREEVLELMRATEAQPIHVTHVTGLALQLFDSLALLHGLGPRERLLLEAAGYLHDIGHQFDYLGNGHHKESARMIREHPWKNFAPDEISVMALVARYHRKTIPQMDHAEFAALPASQRRAVQILSGLLRIADALDRTHEQLVTRVTAEVLPNRILFHLEASGRLLREVSTACKKGDLASAVFQRDLVFMVGEEIIEPLP